MTNETKPQYLWTLKPIAPSDVLARFPEHDDTVVQLVYNRGLSSEAAVERFLLPDYRADQHSPWKFRDMRAAIDRINQAIDKKQRIIIHGDYDADGVCASSVLYLTLKELGANVDVFLPHRDTEGYGLNLNTVDALANAGTDLIITVDCGISNAPEVAAAVSKGIDVIVTDHHSEPPELPRKALAILNPKLEGETYPFKFLAGVGVSFKVCQALIEEHNLGEGFEKWLLDLVAISTVTDFVELIDENRVLLTYGLIVLRKNRRLGLRVLFEEMGVDPSTATSTTIGFTLGPHINAAGRINHANMAWKLLVENDEVSARTQARDIIATNKERRRLSDKMARQALAQAELQKNDFAIIVTATDWPVGLVGLVAGKVASTYHRPTFVITQMGGDIVGSGRSIEHFNLVDGLQSMPELFSKYGGHPMACGFSLNGPAALDEFTSRMKTRAKDLLDGKDLRNRLDIDAEISLDQVNWRLVDTINQCAPYGQANPEPLFVSRRVHVDTVQSVGKTGSHLKLSVIDNDTKRPCIGFGFGDWAKRLRPGDAVDIVYCVGVNEWNGNREIQLEIKDLHQTNNDSNAPLPTST